ncbi:unnamed protein product [Nippostrongylus brasiliensis]|uniref:TIR domain-containing protein n=1 Tax=Nippostrongylus brasiliensis TaxID=27835 RepID=A0A0N4YD96_NIPBR|nr:unnamed protein product [Nippostrongylus brasiliensis]
MDDKDMKDSCSDYTANRSQIVRKLMNMKLAASFADSCSLALEQIQILVNQMVSAGYDVRATHDPVWCETILAKFPHDIVRPVLIATESKHNQTVGDLLIHLKKEIAAKIYVEKR